MPPLDIDLLPEVFLSRDEISYAVVRALKAGTVRKLGPKLYTSNLVDPLEEVVKRNLWQIAGLLFPGAVVSDRTALENVPAADGSVFLASNSKRDVTLPGHTLRARKGPGPIEEDRPFIGGLFIACPARAYLENMAPSRARKSVARRLSRKEVETRLDADLRLRDEAYLLALRDEARKVAPRLGLSAAGEALDAIIGALLGTRDAHLQSEAATARARGRPYDPGRATLFTTLYDELMRYPPPGRADPGRSGEAINLPFFEAYFSNFIEGTEFVLSEAAEIVFEGRIPEHRPADAHDVLGTYRVVSSQHEMTRRPESIDALLSLLQSRHRQLLTRRPESDPGRFKTRPNQAGATLFVSPELVVGTLERGFEFYRTIEHAFHRAVYMMFLVAEVHPFADGNGRLARVMMNAELIADGSRRIIIPTIYRNNYLAALRALSRKGNATPLVRMLDFAQRYTAAIDFRTYETARTQLEETQAFLDPGAAEAEGIRLRLP